MSAASVYHLRLELPDLKQLFLPFDVDPFEGQFRSASGIDQISSELSALSIINRKQISTTIVLPVEDASPDLVERASRAIRGYCEARIVDLKEARLATRREGYKAAVLGVLFLIICLAGSATVDELESSSSLLRHFLGEGLLIVGWVGLWYPAEVLLYGWIPYTRDIRLYERIKAMQLRIEFAS